MDNAAEWHKEQLLRSLESIQVFLKTLEQKPGDTVVLKVTMKYAVDAAKHFVALFPDKLPGMKNMDLGEKA